MGNWIYYIAAAVVAYFIGSFSPSFIIGKIKKVDLKKTATQNLGASNTTVVLGWRYGVLVGALDIAKGALAVLLTRFALPAITHVPLTDLPGIAYLAAAFAVLGHIFPFYLKFRGGKGFATYIGIIAGMHFPVAVLFALVIISLSLITNYIVVGTFTTVVGYPIFILVYTGEWYSALFLAVASIVVIIKHWENIVRIKNGTEGKVRRLFGKGHRERAKETAEELEATRKPKEQEK